MKKVIYLVLIFTLFISCGKNDDENNDNSIQVVLSSNVTGILNNEIIEYRDASGALKSEILPVGKWNKIFTVSTGYDLFIRVSGKINGSLVLIATAKGNGVNFTDTKNINTNTDTSFDLEISKTLLN